MEETTKTATTSVPEVAVPAALDGLFAAGAQYGFGRSRRHPSVKSYIFGSKNGIDIINLEKTNSDLKNALEYVRELGAKGKKIMFVGNKSEARAKVKEIADRLQMPYVAERWVGGTFTNFAEIKRRIARLKELREARDTGAWKNRTKNERALFEKEIAHLETLFGGIENMSQFPDALVVIDSRHEEHAVREAGLSRIPVVALCGSDCNISIVDHPVVANDSALSSIAFFLDAVFEAYREGAASAPTA